MTPPVPHPVRAHVRATATDGDAGQPQVPGEIIVAPDGRYLGSGDSLTVHVGTEYPEGWTNCTWYEQPSYGRYAEGTCTCTDCEGLHTFRRWRQRVHGDPIDCVDAGLYDYWDVGIAPSHFTPGSCCEGGWIPYGSCWDGSHLHHGSCEGDIHCQRGSNTILAGWPLCGFAIANPSAALRVVTDSSGPVGLEDVPALEIDFAGNGLEGATFLGSDGGFDDPGPRSQTGWAPEDGSCWTFSMWVKAVPDGPSGYVCSGYDFGPRFGSYSFPFAHTGIPPYNSLHVILDGTWQYFRRDFITEYPFGGSPQLNAAIAILTLSSNPADPGCGGSSPRPIYIARGRVHVKQVHLGPCSTGVHIARRPANQREVTL